MVGSTYTQSAGKSPLCLFRSLTPCAQPEWRTCSPVSWSNTIRSPFKKLRKVDSSPAGAGGGMIIQRSHLKCKNMKTPDTQQSDEDLLWLGLSWSATTNLDLFLRPSRKETTKSRMSSALLDVKVYSSPLIVAKVKL